MGARTAGRVLTGGPLFGMVLAADVGHAMSEAKQQDVKDYERVLLDQGGFASASKFKRLPFPVRTRLATHYADTGLHHDDMYRYDDGLIDIPKGRKPVGFRPGQLRAL